MLIKALREALSFSEFIDIVPESPLMTGSNITFANSVRKFKGAVYTAFREINRNSMNSWEDSRVILQVNGILIKRFEGGEDPRFFLYRSKIYLYFQEYDPLQNDCRIHIYDIKNDFDLILSPPSAFGINGKNWGIFEHHDDLRIVYSADPLIVASLDATNALKKIFAEREIISVWGDDLNSSFGSHRCGSMPIRQNQLSQWLTFTHITLPEPNKPVDQFGILTFNDEFTHIQRIPLSKYVKGLLIDPYGATFEDNKIEVHVSVVFGELHRKDSLVQNLILKIEYQAFYNLLRNFK